MTGPKAEAPDDRTGLKSTTLAPGTLARGGTVLPDVLLDGGEQAYRASFDVSNVTPDASVLIEILTSIDSGLTWQLHSFADFDGPWTDRQGKTRTDVDLYGPLPRAAKSGVMVRTRIVSPKDIDHSGAGLEVWATGAIPAKAAA